MPAQLGWHGKRFDAIAGVGFFVPTGRYAAGASDNLGKGMWSYEVSGGGTLYLDQARSISVSTTAFWETHGKKEGSVMARHHDDRERQGRAAAHARRRHRQVVPARRGAHRCRLLRAVEDDAKTP